MKHKFKNSFLFLGVPAASIVTLAPNSNPNGRRRVFRCIFCGHSKENAPEPQKDVAPTANAKIVTSKKSIKIGVLSIKTWMRLPLDESFLVLRLEY